MKKPIIATICISSLLFIGCNTTQEYSGTGGMLAHSIKPNVYVYHYENGFTGVDAAGYDPNLQYAWSRLGAAQSCGISYDKKKVLNNLSKKYGKSPLSHKTDIMFHQAQSRRIPNFCNPERIKEIKSVIRMMEKGVFPKKF